MEQKQTADPKRAAFERWCAENGHGAMDDMIMPLDRALKNLLWTTWQAATDAAIVPKERLALNVQHSDCHKAADAFWDYWRANGETHKRGYYESTWEAINQALRTVGVVENEYMKFAADVIAQARSRR